MISQGYGLGEVEQPIVTCWSLWCMVSTLGLVIKLLCVWYWWYQSELLIILFCSWVKACVFWLTDSRSSGSTTLWSQLWAWQPESRMREIGRHQRQDRAFQRTCSMTSLPHSNPASWYFILKDVLWICLCVHAWAWAGWMCLIVCHRGGVVICPD